MISFDNGNICSELGLDKDEKVRIESGDEEVYLQDINIPALSQQPISNFINFQNFITPSAAFDAYAKAGGQLVREAAKLIKGGGGGQPHFASAGGKDVDGLSAAVDKVISLAVK